MAGRVVRPRRQRLTVALLGLGVPALHLQCDRQIAQPAMTLFQCGQRCAVMRFCLDRSAALSEQGTQRLVRFGVIRRYGKCPPQRCLGAVECAACHQAQRKVAQ